MPMFGALSLCLEVPRLEDSGKFYTDAELKLSDGGAPTQSVARLRRRDHELDTAGLAQHGLARELA